MIAAQNEDLNASQAMAIALLTDFGGIKPDLNIFGFTAHDISQPIGSKLLTLAATHWDRFAMRFSGSGISEMASLVIGNAEDCPDNAFICKAQTEHVKDCATCGACWDDETNVAFLKEIQRKS